MTSRLPRSKGLSAILVLALAIAAALFLVSCAPEQPSSSAASSSPAASSSAAEIEVPDVVGFKKAEAEKALEKAGFVVGKETETASDIIKKGNVAKQDPTAGSKAKAGSKVNLVISTGEDGASVEVPDVKGKSQANAEKALKDAGLVPVIGTPKETTEVASGTVVSQSVEAGTSVAKNSKVTITVAAAPGTVQVPDVIGLTETAAKATLEKAGLQVSSSTEYSSKSKGTVIGQSVNAGHNVEKGTTVGITVSAGAKPGDNKTQDNTTTVPNVVGKSASKAGSAIENAGLGWETVEIYDSSVKKGNVISQSISSGQKVDKGTYISLTISLGPEPTPTVSTPDVIGLTWNEAKSALTSTGLKASYEGDKDGIVVHQSVGPGKSVKEGTRVTLVLEHRTTLVPTPDLIGMSAMEAYDYIDNDGTFTLKLKGGEHGTVVDQNPTPGDMVEPGTVITVTIDSSDFE